MERKNTCIGIDIGGTNMRAALVDTDGNIIEQIKVSTGISQGAEQATENLVDMCRSLMNLAAVRNAHVEGVGLGVAGKIDSKKGLVVFSPNLPAMDRYPLGVELQKALEVPVIMENDANVFGLGENWVGQARDLSNWVGLTLGTGVGGVLVLDNELWQGDRLGFVAEIGHLVVDPEGPLCQCGAKGCLEAHSSARALLEGMEAAVKKGNLVTKNLFDLWRQERLTARDIHQAAIKEEPTALWLFDRMGWALGIALSNIFMLLGIRHAVIGGGVSAAWNLFIDPLLESLENSNKFLNIEDAVIKRSLLGDNAALLGAARLVF